jgi:ferredoxin
MGEAIIFLNKKILKIIHRFGLGQHVTTGVRIRYIFQNSCESAVFTHLRIFFMSGTGNSFRVSTWVQEEAEKLGLHATMEPMVSPSGLDGSEIEPGPGQDPGQEMVAGLIFPTHGFTAPWHVLKFACRMPPGKGGHAFCVATQAGFKIGPVYPPGMSGTATFLIALILALKGYRVLGALSVNMPSNWFILHPIRGAEANTAMISRALGPTQEFAGKVLRGERAWLTGSNLFELILGLVLALVSLGYLLVGRFFLAKLFFANSRCNGCGICAVNCPVGAIRMRGDESPRPFWRYNCEGCMRCAAFCPKNAVEAGHSWAVLLYLITTVPVSTLVFSHFFGTGETGGMGVMGRVVDLLYLYLTLFLSYYVFQALLRIPAVSWFFTKTTLTHLPWWGRYRAPGVTVENLRGKGGDSPSEK